MLTQSDSLTVRDKRGEEYVFSVEDSDLFLHPPGNSLVSSPNRVRVRGMIYPNGFFAAFFHGLLNRGDFRFVDETGKEWEIRATRDEFVAFYEWSRAPRVPREALADDLRAPLEAAEREGVVFGVIIPATSVPVEDQEPGIDVLIALTEEEALIVTADTVSWKYVRPEARVPLSEIVVTSGDDVPDWEMTDPGRLQGLLTGLTVSTAGRDTVCRLTTTAGDVLFLQMAITDVEELQSRTASVG